MQSSGHSNGFRMKWPKMLWFFFFCVNESFGHFFLTLFVYILCSIFTICLSIISLQRIRWLGWKTAQKYFFHKSYRQTVNKGNSPLIVHVVTHNQRSKHMSYSSWTQRDATETHSTWHWLMETTVSQFPVLLSHTVLDIKEWGRGSDQWRTDPKTIQIKQLWLAHRK